MTTVEEAVYRGLRSSLVTMNRTLWCSKTLAAPYGTQEILEKVNMIDDANLVCSRMDNGMHAPVLDLDITHRLVPSTTRGHSHLYLDVPITWRKYKKMLRALAKAGVIEWGYYKASVKKRGTFVRVPGVYKK